MNFGIQFRSAGDGTGTKERERGSPMKVIGNTQQLKQKGMILRYVICATDDTKDALWINYKQEQIINRN